ncbi:hypothetical protein BDZ89DRAFT_1070100 [Hymenopellis radicata]|nr:hypothetical protein BDZ89DRAFT_1070100 [Hymenopellis radicata]
MAIGALKRPGSFCALSPPLHVLDTLDATFPSYHGNILSVILRHMQSCLQGHCNVANTGSLGG